MQEDNKYLLPGTQHLQQKSYFLPYFSTQFTWSELRSYNQRCKASKDSNPVEDWEECCTVFLLIWKNELISTKGCHTCIVWSSSYSNQKQTNQHHYTERRIWKMFSNKVKMKFPIKGVDKDPYNKRFQYFLLFWNFFITKTYSQYLCWLCDKSCWGYDNDDMSKNINQRHVQHGSIIAWNNFYLIN